MLNLCSSLAKEHKNAVRPAVPPSYYLAAHLEKRPKNLPEIPCPLYGELVAIEEHEERPEKGTYGVHLKGNVLSL